MGKFVTYSVGNGRIRARILTRHKDGGVTVEPYFWLDKNGEDTGPLIGGKVRLRSADCELVVAKPLCGMAKALGLCITQLSFAIERALEEKDEAAFRQLVEAKLAAITALKEAGHAA